MDGVLYELADVVFGGESGGLKRFLGLRDELVEFFLAEFGQLDLLEHDGVAFAVDDEFGAGVGVDGVAHGAGHDDLAFGRHGDDVGGSGHQNTH